MRARIAGPVGLVLGLGFGLLAGPVVDFTRTSERADWGDAESAVDRAYRFELSYVNARHAWATAEGISQEPEVGGLFVSGEVPPRGPATVAVATAEDVIYLGTRVGQSDTCVYARDVIPKAAASGTPGRLWSVDRPCVVPSAPAEWRAVASPLELWDSVAHPGFGGWLADTKPGDVVVMAYTLITVGLAVIAYRGLRQNQLLVGANQTLTEQARRQAELMWESTAPRIEAVKAQLPGLVTIRHAAGTIPARTVACWVVFDDKVARGDPGDFVPGHEREISISLIDRKDAHCPVEPPEGSQSLTWICLRWRGPGSAEHVEQWRQKPGTADYGSFAYELRVDPGRGD